DEMVAAAVLLEARGLAVEAGKVGARAENAAGAGEDDHANRRFVAAPSKRASEVFQHRRGQWVALVGSVEGDGGDVTFGREQNLLEGRFFDHVANRMHTRRLILTFRC